MRYQAGGVKLISLYAYESHLFADTPLPNTSLQVSGRSGGPRMIMSFIMHDKLTYKFLSRLPISIHRKLKF